LLAIRLNYLKAEPHYVIAIGAWLAAQGQKARGRLGTHPEDATG
jgi:hypothetical protein